MGWEQSQLWHRLPRCDRLPNVMPDVEKFSNNFFLRLPTTDRTEVALFRTKAGSINCDGAEGSFTAPSLDLGHPQFFAAIEPGVAPLVLWALRCGLVTYTSCEGHLIDGRLYEAHVGTLLPAQASVTRVEKALKRLATRGLSLRAHTLRDQNDGSDHPTLEVYFGIRPGLTYDEYRTWVTETAARLVPLKDS